MFELKDWACGQLCVLAKNAKCEPLLSFLVTLTFAAQQLPCLALFVPDCRCCRPEAAEALKTSRLVQVRAAVQFAVEAVQLPSYFSETLAPQDPESASQ